MFKHHICVSPQSAPLPYSKPFQYLSFFPLLPNFTLFPPWTVTSITLILFFPSIIFSICTLYFNASVPPPYAHATERLNALNGDSFQPFRGLSKLWLAYASAFSSLLLFSDTIFFQPGTRVCVWQVCHCGPLSLYLCITHSYKPLSQHKAAENRQGMPF